MSHEAGTPARRLLPLCPGFLSLRAQDQYQMCLPKVLASESPLSTPRPWSQATAGMPRSPGPSKFRHAQQELASPYPDVHHRIQSWSCHAPD